MCPPNLSYITELVPRVRLELRKEQSLRSNTVDHGQSEHLPLLLLATEAASASLNMHWPPPWRLYHRTFVELLRLLLDYLLHKDRFSYGF